MTEFTERVVAIIKNIPEGKVLTYGAVALLAGNHRGARQVSRILHSMSREHQLPWHRVINQQGRISLTGSPADHQRSLLEKEGVCFNTIGKIDLQTYQWKPGLTPEGPAI